MVEGLITALNALPKVIEMITAAPDAASARGTAASIISLGSLIATALDKEEHSEQGTAKVNLIRVTNIGRAERLGLDRIKSLAQRDQ